MAGGSCGRSCGSLPTAPVRKARVRSPRRACRPVLLPASPAFRSRRSTCSSDPPDCVCSTTTLRDAIVSRLISQPHEGNLTLTSTPRSALSLDVPAPGLVGVETGDLLGLQIIGKAPAAELTAD